MITYANSAKSPFVTTPYSAVRNDLTYLRVCDKVGNCNYGTTQICIQNNKPSIGGYNSQWRVLYNHRSSCDKWAAKPYGGSCPSGVYGNTIGKVTATYVNNNIKFDWVVANGSATWINKSYYVNFVLYRNGVKYSTDVLKEAYGTTWSKGGTFSGTITKTLPSGTYWVRLEGNSVVPSYSQDMGTIVVP